MTKSKKGTKENPITTDDIAKALKVMEKPFEIKGAVIKDGFCKYSYQMMNGPTEGDVLDRKGAHIVHDDMTNAFEKLNVHCAVIDDAFKFSKITIESIEDMREHELTQLFSVSGFKIGGSEENESVVLTGIKWVSEGGNIAWESTKIKFDGGYKWISDLRECVDKCIDEVYQYMNGKCQPKIEQGKLEFETSENDFSGAAV